MRQSILEQCRIQGFEKGEIIGRQEGWQDGRQDGLGITLFDLLADRFNTVPTSLREKVYNIKDTEMLRNLVKMTVKTDSLENFEMLVDKTLDNNK